MNMNYKNFLNTVKKVHKETERSHIFITLDMIYCGFKYQAGYLDYYLFEMYNLNKKQRKTIVTRGINNQFIKTFNNLEYTHIFANKQEFNKYFDSFIKRDWLLLTGSNQEAFSKFIKNKKEIFAKPINGTHGDNMQKIDLEKTKEKDLYKYLMNHNLLLIEEVVIQNETMNQLNPSSINTIRVISVCKNQKATIIAAYLRIGNGKIVDNFNAGGMVVPIDLKTGTIKHKAINKKNIAYAVHPTTNTPIIGFTIPEWDNVLNLVKQAAKVIPEVGFVGWDVAISNKGPLLIEGNEFPGHDIYQLKEHRKDGIGMLPVFEKATGIKIYK